MAKFSLLLSLLVAALVALSASGFAPQPAFCKFFGPLCMLLCRSLLRIDGIPLFLTEYFYCSCYRLTSVFVFLQTHYYWNQTKHLDAHHFIRSSIIIIQCHNLLSTQNKNPKQKKSKIKKARTTDSYSATELNVKIRVAVGDGEPVESAIRRFKREVNKSGHLGVLRHKRYFENSQEKKKRKIKEARLRIKFERMQRRRMANRT